MAANRHATRSRSPFDSAKSVARQFSRLRSGGPVQLGNAPVHFSSDPNSIVTVNVQTIEAPTPNNYQQFGCFVSFGATNLVAPDVAELTQDDDLTAIVKGTVPIVSITWAAGVATVTTATALPTVEVAAAEATDAQNYGEGSVGNEGSERDTATPFVGPAQIGVSGCIPVAYNGMFAATVVSPTSFTYPLVTDPGGPATVMGTAGSAAGIELSQMATTFFSQGNMVSVWVLELGSVASPTAAATALQSWLNLNPRSFYGYLLPRVYGATTAAIDSLKPIFAQYQNPNAMTYFWLTVNQTTMNYLGPTFKDVIQMIEAPSVTTDPINAGASNGEFTMAAMFYTAMQFRPSMIARVSPMAFKYLYGVTPYPTKGNGPLLTNFKRDNTNYVATGAEGGISKTIVYQGVTLDGEDYFNWWWTIDWVAINLQLDLSNAIINGSNNPLAPLYYDQPGIDFLHSVTAGTMRSASLLGMVVGPVTMTQLDQPGLQGAIQQAQFEGQCDVNAVPFIPYTRANPGDFKIGEYDGLSVVFIPARGFIHILVQVIASSLVTV